MSDTKRALPSQDEMLLAVGRADQSFVMLEFALTAFFADIMEPANRQASATILDSARHMETKLRIIDAVAAILLDNEATAKFNNILNRVRRRVEFRNKLAHWMVNYWPGANTPEDIANYKVALVPPLSSAEHMHVMWGGGSAILVQDVMVFIKKCQEVLDELVTLGASIKSGAGRRQEDGGNIILTGINKLSV